MRRGQERAVLKRRRHEGLVPDGAIKCLYEQYGFWPEIIAGTSVGAINGIKLTSAPPLAVNDAEAILTAVDLHIENVSCRANAGRSRSRRHWLTRSSRRENRSPSASCSVPSPSPACSATS